MRSDRESSGWGLRLAAGAIIAAPFIALLYRVEAGIFMMAVALGAVSMLLHGAIGAAPPRARRRLWLVFGFNVSVALACIAMATWMLLRG